MGNVAPNGPARLAEEVVRELLSELQTCVTTYPEGVERTPATFEGLICGTAVFPGGAGLWRGNECGAPLPPYFPVRPLMLIAHNFGNISSYCKAKERRGESRSAFWITLKSFLDKAKVELSECFYTNALMGLKPGDACGSLPRDRDHREQSRAFLARQVKIVNPRALITLGGESKKELHSALKRFPELGQLAIAHAAHPSAYRWIKVPDRNKWMATQADKIRDVAGGY